MAELIVVANDEVHLAALAAERLTQLIESAAAAHGSAFVSLAGGQTPRHVYSNLAAPGQPWRDRIPWRQVHLFWSDERHVPPDHPDSNYGMAKSALIDHVPISPGHVHRMRGELPDAQEAAADYERTLEGAASAFRPNDRVFDLMLLGLGEDGHIASIFPDSEVLELNVGHPHAGRPMTARRAAAVWAPHLNVWRLTLTREAILDSRAIVVLVAGANKAAAVYAAIKEPLDVERYPAQLLRAAGDRVEWIVDRAAASRL